MKTLRDSNGNTSSGVTFWLMAAMRMKDRRGPGMATVSKAGAPAVETVAIPGPLRSFMRMAAISQKVTPEDVLPLLSRNVFMQGYQRGTPTEFLLLLGRYVQQARELQILAGTKYTIRVDNCD